MEYTKPVIVAQNNQNGSFAAGCPAKDSCGGTTRIGASCQNCERTR
ncbi:MAG: hypothetical protein FWB78_10370 [Treponema sp.]|nr:hypothetical protein [Treponema sp.]